MPWMPEVFIAEAIRREALRAQEAASTNDAVAYYEGIMAGDPDALVRSFAGQPVLDHPRAFVNGSAEWLRERDGYAREPSGGAYLHRGAEGLRGLYSHLFANGGSIPLEHCSLTDDGVRCAIEYNCARWGVTDIPPQAGVAVYERGSSGLLAAARIYDAVEPPAVSDTSSE